MQAARNIIAAVLHYFTGAASTVEASAEGASMVIEKTSKYPNGDTYIGHVDNDGQRDGQGILTKANGDVYEGQFKGGMRHGEGKYTWADGDVYDGEFGYDFMHGKGKMKFKDGQEYDGEWQGGEWQGKGIFKRKDGTVNDVVCNNGQVVHMPEPTPAPTPAPLRLKRSTEVIWHHLEALLVLGALILILWGCGLWRI